MPPSTRQSTVFEGHSSDDPYDMRNLNSALPSSFGTENGDVIEALKAQVQAAEMRELAALRGSAAKDEELDRLRRELQNPREGTRELDRLRQELESAQKKLRETNGLKKQSKVDWVEEVKELQRDLMRKDQEVKERDSKLQSLRTEILWDLKRSTFCREDGSTPLHEACNGGDLAKVTALLVKGADPNARNNSGMTPLFEACKEGHLEVARHLLQVGCFVNLRGCQTTPMHAACLSGHLDIVKLLVEKGADINAKNWELKIPLQTAREHGNYSIVQYLQGR